MRTLRGWRRELVGAELLELLAGNRSLGVLNGRWTWAEALEQRLEQAWRPRPRARGRR